MLYFLSFHLNINTIRKLTNNQSRKMVRVCNGNMFTVSQVGFSVGIVR